MYLLCLPVNLSIVLPDVESLPVDQLLHCRETDPRPWNALQVDKTNDDWQARTSLIHRFMARGCAQRHKQTDVVHSLTPERNCSPETDIQNQRTMRTLDPNSMLRP